MKALLLAALLLSGCVSYKHNGEWVTDALFSVTPTRTDITTTFVRLNLVSRDEVEAICPTGSIACARHSDIWMHSKAWGEGVYTSLVTVKFITYGRPYREGSTIYTYDYHINSNEVGLMGEQLASIFNLPPNQINSDRILGHEFKHVLGYPDIDRS